MTGGWRLALRNLSRNKRRSLATLLSIAVGAGGLLFTFGYIQRGERYLRTAQIYHLHTGHLSIYRDGALERSLADPPHYNLSAEEQARIRGILGEDPNVERVAPHLLAAGLLTTRCRSLPYRALGVDPQIEAWVFSQPDVLSETPELARFIEGHGLWEGEGAPAPIAISRELAAGIDKLHAYQDAPARGEGAQEAVDCDDPAAVARHLDDGEAKLVTTTFGGAFTDLRAQIVGVFNPGFTEFERSAALAPLAVMQALHDTDTLTYLAVYLRDSEGIEDRAASLQARLRAAGLGVTVYPWNHPDTSPQYVSTSQLLVILGTFIFAVMASVVALSIVNTVTLTILERHAELGMLRAVGFNRRQVLSLFLREALILTLLGGAVGLSLGYLGAAGVNALNIRFEAPSISGTWQFMVKPDAALGVAIVLALGSLAAVSTLAATSRTLGRDIVALLQPSRR